MFEPGRLATEIGRQELLHLAKRYYKVTHDAIRRYDPHHLILGDRYESQEVLPMEIIRAADPYVDSSQLSGFRRTGQILGPMVPNQRKARFVGGWVTPTGNDPG